MNGAFQVFFEGWIFIFLALCAVGALATARTARNARKRLATSPRCGCWLGGALVVFLRSGISIFPPLGGGGTTASWGGRVWTSRPAQPRSVKAGSEAFT